MLDVLTIKFYLLSKPVTPLKMAIMVAVGLLVALFGILLFANLDNSPLLPSLSKAQSAQK